MSKYRLVACEQNGEGIDEFTDFDITEISWELNGEGTLNFTVPTLDPKVMTAITNGAEIQVYRNGQLLQWGVPVRWTVDRSNTSIQCAGLFWYFSRRYFGRANRFNWLSNPSFESPINTGSAFGNWVTSGVQEVPNNGLVFLGTTAAQLNQANSNTDTYLAQNVNVIPGNYYTGVAWLYIGALAGQWLGPAFENRGLFLDLVRVNGDGSNTVVNTANAPIDLSFEAGKSYRLQQAILVPNDGGNYYIQFRLYAPGGTVIWDAASLTLMESLSDIMTDQATIVNDIVMHAQGKDRSGNTVPSPGTGYAAGYGKSDLLIGTNCPSSGIIRTRVYQHADHQKCSEAINEFATLDDGLDFDIVITPKTRTFTTYYPRKGSQTPLGEYTLETERNIKEFQINVDNEQTATSVTVLGGDDGPGREEANAQDTTYTNGLVLEAIYNTIPGTPIDGLQAVANEQLRRTRKPTNIPELTTNPDFPYIGILQTGDVVPVKIQYGQYNIIDNFRIVKMVLSPKDDSMVITLNEL